MQPAPLCSKPSGQSSICLATVKLQQPPASALSKAWPAGAVQVRCAHSSRDHPGTAADSSVSQQAAAAAATPSSHRSSVSSNGGRGRGKGRVGVAAAGVQPGTPRQQRWSPQSSSRGAPVNARQLTVILKGCETPQQLLQQLQQHSLEQQGGVVNAIHFATSYHRLGGMCQANAAVAGTAAAQQLLQHLDQLLSSVRQQLEARGLANIIWSCAYAQHVAPVAHLLAAFLQPRTLSDATSQNVANVLWALASLEQQVPEQQLQQLVAALVNKEDDAVPQGISSSVWALGKLLYKVPQQQLGKLLAAFTAAGMLRRANTQEISNVLLGMAYMGQQLPDAQLQLLLAELSAKSDQADPQHLSNSLWAVAKLGQQVRDSKLLQQLVVAVVGKRSRVNTQDIANTLWAVSEMRQQVQAEPLGKLLTALVKQLHRAVPQGISNTLLACARFRYAPVQLLAALEQQQHLQRFLATAEPQHLANTAWACGMLGHSSKLLLGGLLQQAVKLLEQDSSRFVCQTLCNLCWAVAMLDLRQYVPAVLQLAEAASVVWGSAAPEGLQQLYQVQLWLQDHSLAMAEGGKGPGLLQVLSQQQLDECRQAWQDQVAASAAVTPSLLQQQVFNALQQLPGWQVPPQQEVLTADRNFSIDVVAVTAAGVRLAVEVDGPSHFISPSNSFNGPTQNRTRALAARGYTVVSIPYWKWDGLRGSEQQGYLRGRLQGLTPSAQAVFAASGPAPADQPPPAASQEASRARSVKRRRRTPVTDTGRMTE